MGVNILGRDWVFKLGIVLIILSAVVYGIHYVIFRDFHHIFIYLVGDIAFVFVEVLLTTLVIHRLLHEREKKNRLEKINMVIESFFSEIGNDLLARFSDSDPKLEQIREELIVDESWTEEEFKRVSKTLGKYDYEVEMTCSQLNDLRDFLKNKRLFMMRLLENPTLLEHESFTQLLRAVFHLTEELMKRDNFEELPESDYEHLHGDIERVYNRIVHEWLDYMVYLKDNFPYLFSIAMRTNPFDQEASPIVEE